MFNCIKYYQDHHIHSVTDSSWVNTHCPLCRSQVTATNPNKEYLGFNLESGHFHCWRCGGHDVEDVVMALERCDWLRAVQIKNEYETDFEYRPPPGPQKQAIGLSGSLDWPPGTIPLQDYHRQYLRNRGYDPDWLEARYGVMGTVNAGPYAARVIVPVFWQGKMVSYQGRDITGKAMARYKACYKDKELIFHEDIIYDLDRAGDIGIVVEGVFDAWRLGDGAVATFGTSMDKVSPQILILAHKFRKAFIMFDAEPPAQRKARWLRDQLSALGVEAVNVVLQAGDPGDLSDQEAQKLKKELGL